MTQDAAAGERLRALVLDVPDFPSAGVMFRDISPLLADAWALRDAVNAMAAPFIDAHVEFVAGIESRGFILGGAIAAELGAGFIPVRKKGRLPRRTVSVSYELEYGSAELEVHAEPPVTGKRILIADDVLATGGTAGAALSLMHQLHAVVAGCTFLIELQPLGGRGQLSDARVESLLRY